MLGGHVRAGESCEDAVIREMKVNHEELEHGEFLSMDELEERLKS